MDTTKTKTHADPPLGSRWAQMWAYMWAEQLVIFWYMLPKVTFTYLDNVLVYSETHDDHLHHLNTVFERFQKACHKIKLCKCQCFKTHLHYLGHRISANGLEPLPEKLKAIGNLAPTKNIDEACHILGLLGYYRSFVPAFANITLPITNLLKTNTPFVWSDKCQLALE